MCDMEKKLRFAVSAMFLLLFCIYGAWFFITSLEVDFEYAFLSSVFRIDKVIAKRRRRKMVKVDVKSIDDIFRYNDKDMARYRYKKVYNAGAKEFSEDNMVFVYREGEKGWIAIIFTPSDEFLAAMKPYFNNELRKKLFLNKQL